MRLRIFAGPNGSGKSTIIQAVKNYKVKEVPVDFGIYINADDIACALRNNKFSFGKYQIKVNDQEFLKLVLASGLINEKFPESTFRKSYKIVNNKIELLDKKSDERLAQILADYLRKKLLIERKKFSFETVFSHPSKLEIMKEAAALGYKVYLYFVSTEDPEINKFRVKIRAQQGGHNVRPDLIESRYYRSLDLLYEAAQNSYQTYFFDNSNNDKDFKLFAHFKNIKGEKKWDDYKDSVFPGWFLKYYVGKKSKKQR